MTQEEIQREAQGILLIHHALQIQAQQMQMQISEESVQKYASGIYIKLNPKQSARGGGSYGGGGGGRKPDVPKEQQRGSAPTQVKQVGVPCEHCSKPLVNSKGGYAYCKCWYEADPAKAQNQPSQQQQLPNVPQQHYDPSGGQF